MMRQACRSLSLASSAWKASAREAGKQLIAIDEIEQRHQFAAECMDHTDSRRGDAKLAHVGEVGKAEPTRRMLLSEDDILLGTIYGAPSSNAPLRRSTHAWADLRMTTANLLEDGNRADARRRRQHRYDFAVPYTSQRIGTATAAWRLLLRR